MSGLDLVSFDSLACVPVKPAPRKIGRAFLATLEQAIEDLWVSCPWGRAERIIHMGAYVDRPDPAGTDRHAQGRAIDIGQIVWRGDLRIDATDPEDGGIALDRYLAVTAVLALHLGCVLNYWQPDGKHRSHWHLDDHRAPGWSPSWRPSVRFLQASLRALWGLEDVVIDGVYGPRSAAAATAAGLDPDHDWPGTLAEISRRGFR